MADGVRGERSVVEGVGGEGRRGEVAAEASGLQSAVAERPGDSPV